MISDPLEIIQRIFLANILTFIDMSHTICHIYKNRCERENKMENKNIGIAKVFKAFCDENRITILQMLQSGEKCACILLDELEISQSTLSHHMKILVDSGVVNARKEGKWTHYSISEEGSKKAEQLLIQITSVDRIQSGACQLCK